jgi:hypothetical protein
MRVSRKGQGQRRNRSGDRRNPRMKTYKVIVSSKHKKIEDAINEAASDGWEVQEFGYGSVHLAAFWALLVKED